MCTIYHSILPNAGKQVSSSFADIISLNYGRNPIFQKNERSNRIDYRFKFRDEDVCITLEFRDHVLGGSLYMYVDGDGRINWCKEATHILRKQCERLEYSRELQISEAFIPEKAGVKKKQLVSEEEFHNCFAIPFAYGTNGSSWPRSTILLYKYSSNATNQYWKIPENTWIRIDNKPGQDAEKIMKGDLENIQDYLTIQPDDNEGSYKAILSVEVILSYSPCDDCAQVLCDVKKTLDEKVKQSKIRNKGTDTVENLSKLSLTEIEEEAKVKFKITFSNFYKHLKSYRSGNMEGLKDLMRSGIKLDVFSDDNWEYFFNAAGLVTKRQRRERDDKKILQYLEGVVTSERIPAIEQDLRENELL